jgi:hypothetical protein
MPNLKLSKQGKNLIKLYERMVVEGYDRQDGSKVENTYNDFELKKFRNICKEYISNLVDELFSLTKKLLVINVACYKAAALLPNGENAHITVRSPDWWKGVIDSAAVKYPDVKVLLICSQTYKNGVIFQPFKSKDWHSSNQYSIEYEAMTFQ